MACSNNNSGPFFLNLETAKYITFTISYNPHDRPHRCYYCHYFTDKDTMF